MDGSFFHTSQVVVRYRIEVNFLLSLSLLLSNSTTEVINKQATSKAIQATSSHSITTEKNKKNQKAANQGAEEALALASD